MTIDEVTLQIQARELIQSGRIPGHRPDRTWGGTGSLEECALCGSLIDHSEISLEGEFAGIDGAGPKSYSFHARCFAAVDFAISNLNRSDGASFRDVGTRASAPVDNAGSAS